MLRIRFRPFLFLLLPLGYCAAAGSVASACTIPVFRYALERWEADRLLVVVYYNGRLAADDEEAVKQLAEQSSLAGGPLNIEVVRYDLAAESPPVLVGVEPAIDQPLPWVEIRSKLDSVHTALRWQGPLADIVGKKGVLESPARGEIVRRLFAGHSAVWLLVAPEGQEQKLGAQLQGLLDGTSKELVLPEGIGLPGSELYASIPLAIRFSVLAVSHSDPAEQQLFKQLASAAADWKADAAYVIPVFGRLRALEVFPMEDTDELLVRDVSEFLCGACSCRVKQANPGFDLIAPVKWEERLFGGALPDAVASESPASLAAVTAVDAPQYVAIPSGNQSPDVAETSAMPEQTQKAASQERHAQSRPLSAGIKTVLLLAALVLIGAGILGAVVFRKR